MKIYNTLSRTIEQIVPQSPGQVSMYTCGPTVYRNIHVGNLRAFTMADWLRRALEAEGLRVTHIKNITDVGHMRLEVLDRGEDKIIAQARQEGKSSAEIATFYTKAFLADERAVNILPAHLYPRATAHIRQMIDIVWTLVEQGTAYVVLGNVFFDVTRFATYGQLSGNRLDQALEELRGDVANLKRHPEDFPLWKAAEPGREMAWDSPWGRGFPGWHIECSAMSMHYLGPRIDVHTGGVDNIFPHHEDELAQSEACTGEQFVSYWVHSQHLLCDGLKMAKSTGNAYTLDDVLARGFNPLALRYLFTTALYRSRLNFTFSALRMAEASLHRLHTAVWRMTHSCDASPVLADGMAALPFESLACARDWYGQFLTAVQHDLNLPRAMGIVWTTVRQNSATQPAACLAFLLAADTILGFDLARAATRRPSLPQSDLPTPIQALVHQRASARTMRSYDSADLLREQVHHAGFQIADTDSGPAVTRLAAHRQFPTISRSTDSADLTAVHDRYDFSVLLLAHNSRSDLQRCVESIVRHNGTHRVEIVVLDNGSTDDTVDYLREVARHNRLPDRLPVRVIFADHNMGFAAGRNATLRASLGRYVVMMDTSMEMRAPIWATLAWTLADPSVGLAGPYGLVTSDLREFQESDLGDVDAVEGYLMAFRRTLLSEIGWLDEKFRFYRLLDIHMSFFVKAAGYRVVTTPHLQPALHKHPHREWYALTAAEQRTRSKKNYDVFRRRWHHGESLLVAHYVQDDHWPGHDHTHHLGRDHTHTIATLPAVGSAHRHLHHHWPDHNHDHLHTHAPIGRLI